MTVATRMSPERTNPAVVAAYVGCAGTVIASVVTGLVTLLAGQSQPSVPTKSSIVAGQSHDPCPSVAEQYRAEIHREPGMIGVLVSVASADPDARRCGINARALRLMLGQ